jgi:hypothetical protein
METDIKTSLTALLDAIRRSDGPAISLEMGRLDEMLVVRRDRLHPQLAHFLERRSYAKAHLFLGGESDIPVGSCGGRP